MSPVAKTCFIIAPLGDQSSDTRRRSDQVRKHIIEPIAIKVFKYEVIRADDISEPGMITAQVISHLGKDDLVIADLTDRNPNVYFELAIRYAYQKPVVQLVQRGQPLPFDVAPIRTIVYDSQDWDSVEECRRELEGHLRSIEEDPSHVVTPLSLALNLQGLQQSENPLAKSNAEILIAVTSLSSQVRQLSDVVDSVLRPLGFASNKFHLDNIWSDTLARQLGDNYLKGVLRSRASRPPVIPADSREPEQPSEPKSGDSKEPQREQGKE